MISKDIDIEDRKYRDNTRTVEWRRGYHVKGRKSITSGLYSMGSGVEIELWNLVREKGI